MARPKDRINKPFLKGEYIPLQFAMSDGVKAKRVKVKRGYSAGSTPGEWFDWAFIFVNGKLVFDCNWNYFKHNFRKADDGNVQRSL